MIGPHQWDALVSRWHQHATAQLGWVCVDHVQPPEGLFAGLDLPLVFDQGAGVTDSERHERLLAAVSSYAYVVLDLPRDAALLAQIPASRRYLRATRESGPWLPALEALWQHDAVGYLMVGSGRCVRSARALLEVLGNCQREDTCAWVAGPDFAYTQILAACLGAPLVFASLEQEMGEQGYFPLRVLRESLGFPWQERPQQIYGILGENPYASRFPGMHNPALRRLGLKALFLPMVCRDFAEFFEAFLRDPELAGLGMRGFTVLAPHKQQCLAFADEVTELAHGAQAANVFVYREGKWLADASDGPALMALLLRDGGTLPRWAAVVGVGGTGRAVTNALVAEGVKTVVVNRSMRRGIEMADAFNCIFQGLDCFRAGSVELVVHVTPAGKNGEEAPFSLEGMEQGTLVEFAYGKETTHLVRTARAMGLEAFEGRDILLENARYHFQAMTGQTFPDEVLV